MTTATTPGADAAPPPAPERACYLCRFWGPDADPEATLGECRRRAPAAIPVIGTSEVAAGAVWPITECHDWCGDFDAGGVA